MQIHTMQILMSKILCVGKIGSRPASACETISITTTARISAPGRPQKPDFPPPALLVYETHNGGRLGKKKVLFSDISLPKKHWNQQTARPPGCKCGRAGTHANATRECLAVVPNPTRTLPSRGRPSPSRSATLRKSGFLAIKFPAGAS